MHERRDHVVAVGRVLLGCLDNRPPRAPRPDYLLGIGPLNSEPCTWCGDDVDRDDGFLAYEPAGGRRAVFCRLEHIIPWAIQGSHWGGPAA
jgi:hypothetical protein